MLPPNIAMQIDALKKLQLQMLHREADFHKQVHSMETDFQQKLTELYDKRRQIVAGTYAPTPADLLKPEDFKDVVPDSSPSVGIPEFWLTVFRKAPILGVMIQNADEQALKHLVDLRCVMNDQPRQGFVLEFEFEPNEFFTNKVLTKEYLMECVPDAEKAAMFNGFEIVDTVGCEIGWKEGVDLTKASEDGQMRLVNSFFNFFNPKKLLENVDPLMSKHFLETDFEVGYYIKERVIPRALFFYSGEIAEAELDSLDDDSLELEEAEILGEVN